MVQNNGLMFVRGASLSSTPSSLSNRFASSATVSNNNARQSLASNAPYFAIKSVTHRASSFLPHRAESTSYQTSIKDILARLNEQKATSQPIKFPKRSPSIMSSTSSSSFKSKKSSSNNSKVDKFVSNEYQSDQHHPC